MREQPETVQGEMVLSVNWDSAISESSSSIYRQHLKRWIDIFLASFGLLASLPIILLAMGLVSLLNNGSPIFCQRRVGINGCIFTIYKLRTMEKGSELQGFRTLEADERVTRLGALMRKYKIDELPQLWNVLCGDMSLIGPRPLSLDEHDYLMKKLDFGPANPGFEPTVRPGMTGLEQVSRTGAELSYPKRFDLNCKYEREYSFIMDVQIFLATVGQCSLVTSLAAIGGILQAFLLLN